MRDELWERIMDNREFVFDVVAGVVARLRGDLLNEIAKQVGEVRAGIRRLGRQDVSTLGTWASVGQLPDYISGKSNRCG